MIYYEVQSHVESASFLQITAERQDCPFFTVPYYRKLTLHEINANR